MSEAIREILFHVTPEGIEPSRAAAAGIQGEHNATEVKFQLDEALVKDGYFYRFEFVDGTGGMYTTDFVTPEGNAVAVKIPAAWTASGGCGTLRLCVAELSEDYQEEMVVLSFAGRLLFSGRDSTSPLYSYYEPGLSGLIESTHAAAENANTAADEAREAARERTRPQRRHSRQRRQRTARRRGARGGGGDAEAAATSTESQGDADAASADAVQAAEEAREAAGEAGRAGRRRRMRRRQTPARWRRRYKTSWMRGNSRAKRETRATKGIRAYPACMWGAALCRRGITCRWIRMGS